MHLQTRSFTDLKQKPKLETYQIKSKSGISAEIINFGARIKSIKIPTATGYRDVVLSYPNLNTYGHDPFYLGAICGRYAGRIRNGHFALNGDSFLLNRDLSVGPHALHGGAIGFSKKKWERVQDSPTNEANLKIFSADGDQGFPGNLSANVRYELLEPASLLIDLTATTDKPTAINLASHIYFNLDGTASHISDHTIQINAQEYTVQDNTLLPTREIKNVADTPFDMRKSIDLKSKIEELRKLNGEYGFDQNFVINRKEDGLTLAATLTSSSSDLTMQVFTDQPAIQLYTGQYLAKPFYPGAGLCLETQAFPDAPNQSSFPSAILLPEEVYRKQTVLSFIWN